MNNPQKYDVTGKKLLVLGGTSGKDIVLQAKRMGVYTIVADQDDTNAAKRLSDEAVKISTADIPALVEFVKEAGVDGVFSGPSEFNIQKVMAVCSLAGLPFYVTKEQWDICQNKASFKELCRKFDVPVIPEYSLTAEMKAEDLARIKYPVVIKPVDACSSKGLSICKNEEELRSAVPYALSASESGKFIVEKCLTNDYGFGCKYIASGGEIKLSATSDRYTVDEFDGRAHISSSALYPSKLTDVYIRDINENVIRMFKSIGLANGTFFMQALVDSDDGKIYFHEMGLRLSGGLMFSLLEGACGYNDVQMMIRYALGGPMATEEEFARIDPYMHGHFVGCVNMPLKPGIVGKVEGVEEVRQHKGVMDLAQAYFEGDEMKESCVGTLMQHFARVKVMVDSIEEFKELLEWIQDTIKVTDSLGNNMIYRRFDLSRMR